MENKYLKIINIILAINNSSFVIKQSENMHIIKYKNIVFVIIEKMHEIIENIEYTLLCIIKWFVINFDFFVFNKIYCSYCYWLENEIK